MGTIDDGPDHVPSGGLSDKSKGGREWRGEGRGRGGGGVSNLPGIPVGVPPSRVPQHELPVERNLAPTLWVAIGSGGSSRVAPPDDAGMSWQGNSSIAANTAIAAHNWERRRVGWPHRASASGEPRIVLTPHFANIRP
jgi:hypothetical protein